MKCGKWLVVAVLLCALLGLCVSAQAEVAASGKCGDNLKWTLDTEGVLTVSGTGKMKSFDLNMTKFGWTSQPWGYAYRVEDVTKVVISEGVTSISDFAFAYCSNIVSVSIPDSVTEIGVDAFTYCSKLKSVRMPGTETGGYALASRSLTSAGRSGGLTEIKENTFSGCSELTDIVIPDSVKIIGANAFENCRKLVVQKLPENLTEIGKNAFRYCEGLTGIKIPGNVTVIGDSAFENCSNLVKVELPDGLKVIDESAFAYCSSLKRIAIPASVTKIGSYALGTKRYAEVEVVFEGRTLPELDANSLFNGAYPTIYCYKDSEVDMWAQGKNYGIVYLDGTLLMYDVHDALAILQHEAGWAVDIDLAKLDLNGDGAVNTGDAMLILQAYAAK